MAKRRRKQQLRSESSAPRSVPRAPRERAKAAQVSAEAVYQPSDAPAPRQKPLGGAVRRDLLRILIYGGGAVLLLVILAVAQNATHFISRLG